MTHLAGGVLGNVCGVHKGCHVRHHAICRHSCEKSRRAGACISSGVNQAQLTSRRGARPDVREKGVCNALHGFGLLQTRMILEILTREVLCNVFDGAGPFPFF